MTPTVIGLDLSLTATGMAGNTEGGWADVIKPPAKLRGHERLRHIITVISVRINDYRDPYIVIEGPSFGSTTGSFHERAGLWWILAHALWERDIPYASVPPTTLKRYATGKGNATKDAVLVAVTRRYPWCPADNNCADAVTLCAMGADHLQVSTWPTMPAANRVALDKVIWPELKTISRCGI